MTTSPNTNQQKVEGSTIGEMAILTCEPPGTTVPLCFYEWQQARREDNDVSKNISTPSVKEGVEVSDDITWLVVPFSEKNVVKSAGGSWNPQRKQWFAPPLTNLEPLRRWRKECRTYLHSDRDSFNSKHVKSLGARWENGSGKWYISSDMDFEPFSAWL